MVRNGVAQERCPCLKKKDHINKELVTEVGKCFFGGLTYLSSCSFFFFF